MEFKEILGKENYNIEEIKNDMGFKDNKELIKYIVSSFIKNINENEDNSYLFNSFKLLSKLTFSFFSFFIISFPKKGTGLFPPGSFYRFFL